MKRISPMSNVDESVKTGFSATSVHTKETTVGFLSDGVTTSQPDFLPESEDLVEKPDYLSENEVSGWLRDDTSYRTRRLRDFPDLVPVTEQVWEDYDSIVGTNYIERFRKCRTSAWFVRNTETGRLKLLSNSCRLRLCPPCAEARSKVIARSCRDFLEEQGRVRFMTLTMKHSDATLEEQIKLIKKCFVRLRQRVGWRKYVTGCVWFLQLKPIDGGESCHVHYHVLLTGSYMPQKWLSETWEKITGGSFVVDIRLVSDRGNDCGLGLVLSDVARYAARPVNLLEVDREHRFEYVRATEKIRLCGTTGICRDGISLRPVKFVKDDSHLEQMGDYETVRHLARGGDKRALVVFSCWLNDKPVGPGFSCQETDDFIDDKFTGLSPRGPPGMGVQENLWN